MDDNLNFDTFLFISSKKFNISVYSSSNKKLYEKELFFKLEFEEEIIEKFDYFLNENIFKVEKKLGNFIKKVSIVLDLNIFFPVEISVKKNNYENIFIFKNLNYLLNEVRDYCKKTIEGKKIIHMIIDNYQFDGKNFSLLPEEIDYNYCSLDIRFLCISNNYIKNLEKILKKYQISLNQIVSGSYVKIFLENHNDDIFLMAKKITNGYNPNEVILINKTSKKQGFFEKFFNFFN